MHQFWEKLWTWQTDWQTNWKKVHLWSLFGGDPVSTRIIKVQTHTHTHTHTHTDRESNKHLIKTMLSY